MDSSSVLQLVVLFVLLALSAFFSSAETALTTVNRVRVRTLIEEGNKRAIVLQKVLDNYSKMLSAILVGNNVVNLYASSLTTTLAMKIWGNYAVSIATGALTLAVLLFGEIVPKNAATLSSEKIALAYARIILFLMKVLTPIIFLVDKISVGIMRLLHMDPNKKKDQITESELKTYVDVSHEDGVIESEEREMIYNVFDFSDSLAKDIMIPRIDMCSVSVDAGYEELLVLFKKFMYTRIPVYQEENDNIIGMVNVKDLILMENRENFHIKDILRDAYYTYEYKKTADLMMEMREKRHNVAFVLNEYGSCEGMITLEDLLEEIVGEIRDEYDADEDELIQEIAERQYLVEGGMKLDDVNNALGTKLDSEDYDSIGGIIIGILDRMPVPGDEVATKDGITLHVENVQHNRITAVLMTLPEPSEEETEEKEEREEKSPSSDTEKQE